MFSKMLYFSEVIQLKKNFRFFYQPFPFYQSHTQARTAFLKNCRNNQAWQLQTDDFRLFISVEKKGNCMVIDNLLCDDLESVSWEKIIILVENFARSYFVTTLEWRFKDSAMLNEWLFLQGYHKKNNSYEKNLSYHTALVLSGGGARGAYQIGVWRALKKLAISFDFITATSVGALNAALIIMDDVKQAQAIWQDIDTQQILALPMPAADSPSLKQLLGQIDRMAKTAIKEQGISTIPLQQLIYRIVKKGKIEKKLPLFVCTTRLRGLREKVFAVDLTSDSWRYLIASAAFFPAMQASKIGSEYYIDGGYRNDFPIDVALVKGATECICVDAKGPGFRKPLAFPESVSKVMFSSAGSLGNVLLFDGSRSKLNEKLGYLEVYKYFHYYQGYWYTFEKEADWQKEWQSFVEKLAITEKNWLEQTGFWQEFSKYYSAHVVYENAGLAMAEWLGKLLAVRPDRLYCKTAFIKQLTLPKKELSVSRSVEEWLKQYYQENGILSQSNQLKYWVTQLEHMEFFSVTLTEKAKLFIIAAKFLGFLTK